MVALQRNILLKKATDLKAMKQLQFDVLLAPQISKGPSYSPTLAQSPDGGTQPSVPWLAGPPCDCFLDCNGRWGVKQVPCHQVNSSCAHLTIDGVAGEAAPAAAFFFGPAICWSVYIKQVALLLAKHRSARRWRYLFICKWSASERKRRPTFSMNFRGLSIVIKVAALWAVTATIFVNVTQSFNFDTGQVLIKLAGNAGA